jgi:hypothetical protein
MFADIETIKGIRHLLFGSTIATRKVKAWIRATAWGSLCPTPFFSADEYIPNLP